MTNTPPREPAPDASDASEPVTPVDPLDERISAALDGVGEREVPDSHGDDASRFHGAPATERARAMETARDLLAVPPSPVDALTRRRMLRTALAAAPASHHGRRWSRVVAAAAVVVVVGAGGWALTTLDHSSSKSGRDTRAASGATSEAARPSTPVDLGEVANPLVLKQRVQAALGASSGSSSGSAAPPAAQAPATTAAPFSGNASTTAGGARSPARCVANARAPSGTTPELLGYATYRGAPAVVVIARDKSRTLIYVLASADCRLLVSQFLR